jgi:hypothetical protein
MSTIKIEFTEGDNGGSISVEGWISNMDDLNRLYRVCAAWYGEVPPIWVSKALAGQLAGMDDGERRRGEPAAQAADSGGHEGTDCGEVCGGFSRFEWLAR